MIPYKSRSFRRIKVKTPGNRNTTHYVKRKPSKAKCGNCGRPLLGVTRVRASELKRIPKTQKRPQRPFGGVLCSVCSKRVIIDRTRIGDNQSE